MFWPHLQLENEIGIAFQMLSARESGVRQCSR